MLFYFARKYNSTWSPGRKVEWTRSWVSWRVWWSEQCSCKSICGRICKWGMPLNLWSPYRQLRPLHVFTKGRKGESEGTSLIFRLRLRCNRHVTWHQFFTQISFALDNLHSPGHFYADDPTKTKDSYSWISPRENFCITHSSLGSKENKLLVFITFLTLKCGALGSVAWCPYQDFLTESPFLK